MVHFYKYGLFIFHRATSYCTTSIVASILGFQPGEMGSNPMWCFELIFQKKSNHNLSRAFLGAWLMSYQSSGCCNTPDDQLDRIKYYGLIVYRLVRQTVTLKSRVRFPVRPFYSPILEKFKKK